ncbi:DUF4444 domain-containing protein [Tranquillimonas rosea]|uniref:biotin/lipoate--protein ligase family protein n=1 Tax=Tranquillimonas rosea TaxID=641238 RepID=UPI003BABD52E
MDDLSFPPLFRPHATRDPFHAAVEAARGGSEPGLVCHDIQADTLRAAIAFVPALPLKQAVTALPVCGVGFQNAFGALSPPNVAVHLDWDGGVRINGALAGRLQMTADTSDPEAEPDWLVVGLELDLMPRSGDPGAEPDRTSLYDEGCGDIDPPRLLEAWVRHTLTWINTWLEEGVKPVHAEWSQLVHGQGGPITVEGDEGTFVGVDEGLGLLIKSDEETRLIPLTRLLKEV